MNDLVNKIVDYGFWLLLIGLLAAYFAGVATDSTAFVNGARSLLYAATNRNSSGNFVGYPTGGPTLPAGTTTLAA